VANPLKLDVELVLDNASLSKLVNQVRSIDGGKAATGFNKVNASINSAAQSSKKLRVGTKSFTKDIQQANRELKKTNTLLAGLTKRVGSFFKFSLASLAVTSISQPLFDAAKAIVELDTNLNKLEQITGRSKQSIKGLQTQILNLGKSLGVSTAELTDATVILAQAGVAFKDLQKITELLAKSELSPSFDDVGKTAEALIAARDQFKFTDDFAGSSKDFLNAINEVSKNFAVESGNIAEAVRNTGSVFTQAAGLADEFGQSAERSLEAGIELISVFSTVRSTTRLSSSVISSGLRTVIQRLQRRKTEEDIQKVLPNVNLRDDQGQFIGTAAAFREITSELEKANVSSTSQITQVVTEAIGGLRQSKVVSALLNNIDRVAEIEGVAKQGVQRDSIARDAAKAQERLAVELAKVRKEVFAIFVKIQNTEAFEKLISATLGLTKALGGLLEILITVAPLLATLGVAQLGSFAFGAAGAKRGGLGLGFVNTGAGATGASGAARAAGAAGGAGLFSGLFRSKSQQVAAGYIAGREAEELAKRQRILRQQSLSYNVGGQTQTFALGGGIAGPAGPGRPGLGSRIAGSRFGRGVGAFGSFVGNSFRTQQLLNVRGLTGDALTNAQGINNKITARNNRAAFGRFGLLAGAGLVGAVALRGQREKLLKKVSRGEQVSTRERILGAGTSVGGSALTGAIAGASIGSVVPGIGTAVGAGIGAIAGGVLGWFQSTADVVEAQKKKNLSDVQQLVRAGRSLSGRSSQLRELQLEAENQGRGRLLSRSDQTEVTENAIESIRQSESEILNSRIESVAKAISDAGKLGGLELTGKESLSELKQKLQSSQFIKSGILSPEEIKALDREIDSLSQLSKLSGLSASNAEALDAAIQRRVKANTQVGKNSFKKLDFATLDKSINEAIEDRIAAVKGELKYEKDPAVQKRLESELRQLQGDIASSLTDNLRAAVNNLSRNQGQFNEARAFGFAADARIGRIDRARSRAFAAFDGGNFVDAGRAFDTQDSIRGLSVAELQNAIQSGQQDDPRRQIAGVELAARVLDEISRTGAESTQEGFEEQFAKGLQNAFAGADLGDLESQLQDALTVAIGKDFAGAATTGIGRGTVQEDLFKLVEDQRKILDVQNKLEQARIKNDLDFAKKIQEANERVLSAFQKIGSDLLSTDQSIQQIQNRGIAPSPQFQFRGNIGVGQDPFLQQLRGLFGDFNPNDAQFFDRFQVRGRAIGGLNFTSFGTDAQGNRFAGGNALGNLLDLRQKLEREVERQQRNIDTGQNARPEGLAAAQTALDLTNKRLADLADPTKDFATAVQQASITLEKLNQAQSVYLSTIDKLSTAENPQQAQNRLLRGFGLAEDIQAGGRDRDRALRQLTRVDKQGAKAREDLNEALKFTTDPQQAADIRKALSDAIANSQPFKNINRAGQAAFGQAFIKNFAGAAGDQKLADDIKTLEQIRDQINDLNTQALKKALEERQKLVEASERIAQQTQANADLMFDASQTMFLAAGAFDQASQVMKSAADDLIRVSNNGIQFSVELEEGTSLEIADDAIKDAAKSIADDIIEALKRQGTPIPGTASTSPVGNLQIPV
jgi:hypothetical protein